MAENPIGYNQNELNQPKGIEELSSDEEKKPEGKVVIHTMPKRFLRSTLGSDRAKSVGALIMVGGTIFLIGTAIVLYIFVLKPNLTPSEESFKNSVSEVPEDIVSSERLESKQKENQSAGGISNNENGPEIVKIEDMNSATSAEGDKSEDDQIETVAEESSENESDIATTTPIATVRPEIKSAADADKDGLSDVEEMFFGTIVNLKDSDSDGYEDLAEILGLYNPVGEGKIILNSNIEKYTNSKHGYSLYYLKRQILEKAGGSDDSVIFKMDNGHMIQVIVSSNPGGLPIEDWYVQQFNVTAVRNDQKIYKKDWTGVRSDDGLIAYLARIGDNNIYTIAYNLGSDYTVSYKNVLEMFINSFEAK